MDDKNLEESILLYLYDELNAAEREAFEFDLQESGVLCERLAEMRVLHAALDRRIRFEPPEEFLLKSRTEMRARLRFERARMFRPGWWEKTTEWYGRQQRFRQVLAIGASIALGIIIGKGSTFSGSSRPGWNQIGNYSAEEWSPSLVSNVDFIEYEPESGRVAVQFKAVQDVWLEGKIDDPGIRQFLAHAIRTENHPGHRLTAVKATGGSTFSDPELENALIFAMERDEVAGVRLRAAKVLRNLPMSEKIKEAFIRVLLKDSNSALRIEALEALSTTGVSADVLPILRDASRDDQNEFVRLRASKVLERTANPITRIED